ncbi:hypothetical protein ACULMH_13200 [Xanthomonas arboricola pv. corylina]|uniref:hypothetical protein n=1 Tax=Xanthomonas arboricola TaxID=56448 RepID=UPI0006AD0228|nr:hypothetical protein [Xanthomonas arboricola]
MDRQNPYVEVVINLEVEYKFWQIYEVLFRRLPGGGLELCWQACMRTYSLKLNYPRESREQTIDKLLEGKNISVSRIEELTELHTLISRRMDALAARAAVRRRKGFTAFPPAPVRPHT